MLSQLTIFFQRSCEGWGLHIMNVHGSKRWGFNHHWNPELGAKVSACAFTSPTIMTKSRWSLLLGCRLSPRKKLQKWICNISTILFLLCMEYNYILKTIVGASSLRVAGEKRCFFFSFRPSPLQNAQVFQVFFFFSLTRCLIHFLNSSSPLRKRAGWWDRIFFAVNLVGRMKGQGKGMNNFFFPVFWVQKG